MSRSFHANRGRKSIKRGMEGYTFLEEKYNRIYRRGTSNQGVPFHISHDIDEINQKRMVKKQVKKKRKELFDEVNTLEYGLKIEIKVKAKEFVYYPIHPEEIINYLRVIKQFLPRGIIRIHLLPPFRSNSNDSEEGVGERDPHYRTLCHEICNDIYLPVILGRYNRECGVIILYGFICGPNSEIDSRIHFNMYYQTLFTLCHEIAHCFDANFREDLRARYFMNDIEKCENYADRFALELMFDYILMDELSRGQISRDEFDNVKAFILKTIKLTE